MSPVCDGTLHQALTSRRQQCGFLRAYPATSKLNLDTYTSRHPTIVPCHDEGSSRVGF